MQAKERLDTSIETGGVTAWISMQINLEDDVRRKKSMGHEHIKENGSMGSVRAEAQPLFALTERFPAPLPERFPRLTFLGVSLLLLISALTAEFEYLRHAGYYWP